MTDFVRVMLGGWVPAPLHPFVARGIELLLILGIGLLLTWVTRRLFRRLVRLTERASVGLESVTSEDAQRINTLLGMAQTFVILLLWGVVAMVMLGQAGVNIGPLIAGAGIVGVGFGFGAQSLVRDLISGFFIVLENHVRLGDVAVINGVAGQVERITFRVMILRDLEGVMHVFPHGQIQTLANRTMNYAYVLLDIGVAYKENTDRVIAVLRQETERMAVEPAWTSSGMHPPEMLGVESFGPSEVVIRMRIKTRPAEQWKVKREYLRRVKLAFEREGIEIPYPTRSLLLSVAAGELPVRVAPVEVEGGSPSSGSPPVKQR